MAVFSQQGRPMLDQIIRSKVPEKIAAPIATQLVGVAFLRYVLRMPAVVELSEDDLVKHVGRTIQRYLHDGPGSASKII